MRSTFLALLLSSLVSLAASAATPYQVVDLKGVADSAKTSSPQFFGSVRGVALFLASTLNGVAIWRTDGTPGGTSVLKTIYGNGYFSGFVSNGDTAWLSCADAGGWGLWTTDGTTTTALTSNVSSTIVLLGVIGSKVFFVNGYRELWVADGGKLLGLTLITPVFPNPRLSAAFLDNNIYLGTDGGIWKSDGTLDGTTKIATNPAYALTFVNGRLFYGGQTHDEGVELWVSDGSNGGHIVADLHSGPGSTFGENSSMTAMGDRAIFVAENGDLISSDGTESGTSLLHTGTAATAATTFVEFNGAVYFAYNSAFWRSDGTVAGTQLVTDGTIFDLTRTESRMYYIGADSQHTRAIFASDGTAAGRSFIADTDATLFTIAAGKFFFAGRDPYNGVEPWVSDGTAAHLIANLAPDTAGSSRPRNLVATADRLYFVAENDTGTEFWSSDGTASGTKVVTHEQSNVIVPSVVGVSGSTLYVGRSTQLLKVDATSAETLVRNFDAEGGVIARDGIDAGGRFYFRTTSQVYATDGTPAGTLKLTNLKFGGPMAVVSSGGQPFTVEREVAVHALGSTPGATHQVAHLTVSAQSNLLPFGGALLLVAGDSPNVGLWKFSSGANDATLVKSFGTSSFVTASAAANAGTALLFFMRNANLAPFQLWRTDGTADGTTLIKQFPTTVSGTITPLVALGGRAVFALYDGTVFQAWGTDGTADGTKILAQIQPTGSFSTFNYFVADGLAYFPADSRLWQTDGTPEGTKAIAGVTGVTGTGIARLGNTLYFSTTTNDQGTELWAYPLPGPGAVTIDDARANEHDGSVTVTVRLTRASDQRVTVGYETADGSAKAGSDYTAASGTLTFEAGETAKTITITTLNDDAPAMPRGFFVKLKDANVVMERTAAGVTIEDDDVSADLELIFYPDTTPRFDVRNNGPAAASNVVFCDESESVRRCEAPTEFAAGETRTFRAQSAGPVVVGSVTQWERDPVPGNNRSSWSRGNGRIYVSPATLHPGESGTIADATDIPADVAFTSSDPSVIRIDGVSSTTDRSTWWARITALKIGTATITANGGGLHTITVKVAEIVRSSVVLRMAIPTVPALMFGKANEISATINVSTSDTPMPTGTVSFFQDNKPIGNAPVIGQRATIVLRDPAPGTHTYTAAYSGDSRFLPAGSDSQSMFVAKGAVSFSAISSDGVNVLIAARGIDGYAPAGTLTASQDGASRTVSSLTPNGPASATATATGFSSPATTVTIDYSGDAWYETARVTIPITGPHRRSAAR